MMNLRVKVNTELQFYFQIYLFSVAFSCLFIGFILDSFFSQRKELAVQGQGGTRLCNTKNKVKGQAKYSLQLLVLYRYIRSFSRKCKLNQVKLNQLYKKFKKNTFNLFNSEQQN